MGTKSIIPATDKNYYLISSIMEEAIASSQMEGASTTRRIAKDMLRKRLKPINKSARTDLQELVEMGYLSITNLNKRALGYIKSERFEELLQESSNKR